MSTPPVDDAYAADDSRHPRSRRNLADSRGLVALAPAPKAELMLAAVADHANAVKGSAMDQKAWLASIRRRWFPALSLGLIAGSIGAAVAWLVVPLTYTAYSELFVKAVPSKVVFDRHESRQQFDVYRQTQSKMVKSVFVLNAALRNPDIAKLGMLRDEPHPLEFLEQQVSVSNPATEFLRVSLAGTEPKELAAIVNAVTNEYLSEVANAENNTRMKRISELDKAHADMDEKLRSQRTKLQRLVKNLQSGDAVALTEKQKMMFELFGTLRKQRAELSYELMTKKIKLTAKEESNDPDHELELGDSVIESYLADDPEIQRAQRDVNAKQEYLLKMEKSVGKNPDNKKMAGAQRDMEVLQKNLETLKTKLKPIVAERLRTEMKGKIEASTAELRESTRLIEMTIKQVDDELEKQKFEVEKTGIASFEVESLREDLEQYKKLDQKINEEKERLRIEQNAESRVILHRSADVPYRPDYEKKFRVVGLAGFGGLLLLFGGIVFLDVRAQRINSLEEVATGLRLPILGSLPAVPRRAANSKSRGGLAKADIWQGPLMESIDSARVMLLRRAELEDAKVAMIVSAMMSEGKTTLSCHLATSLARAGHRTLLIDSDIRRPTVHRVFDVPAEPGMCELLRDEAQLADTIVPTMQDGLFVLPAGRVTQEALRELAQDALNPIMGKLRDDYDFVIIDSSPILPVTDSLLVSQYVDGVIFSIRRDVSQYPKVATACQRLAMIGIPLWGAVVIGLDQISYGYRYAYPYGVARSV